MLTFRCRRGLDTGAGRPNFSTNTSSTWSTPAKSGLISVLTTLWPGWLRTGSCGGDPDTDKLGSAAKAPSEPTSNQPTGLDKLL